MAEQSKETDPEIAREALHEVLTSDTDKHEIVEEGSQADADDAPATEGVAKKKKSKKAKLKKVLGKTSSTEDGPSNNAEGPSAGVNPASKLTSDMVQQLLEMNPSLKSEVAGMSQEQAAQKIKTLEVADLITGMAVSGKNQKDMASYKFWQTQPVPRLDETHKPSEEGPIKIIDPAEVSKTPRALYDGFDWVTMDLQDEKQIEEVYQLLNAHYVEDAEASFRLSYSQSFLNWALKSPGWRPDWHVGVRAVSSKKLVAFISGIPITLRVRSKVLRCTEINFLCVHKKLRDKRLTPVLIEEITRRCYLLDIFQAIYTAGIVLPKPVSSCRYYHRPINWTKLFEVGFSGLPAHSTKQRQVAKNALPSATALNGLRPLVKKDVQAVQHLLERYLARFEMAPKMTNEEIEHWLVYDAESKEQQVIWAYVLEDPASKKITDFFSFYCLDSSVIGSAKHSSVHVAYLYYYATEAAFDSDEKKLKDRLNVLISDALIIAKKAGFDVFNAVTNLDQPLFLEQQKFAPGDGQLHYYLYNYRASPIAGGVDAKNNADPTKRGGVGVVML